MKTELITFIIFCITFGGTAIICRTIDFIEKQISRRREERGYIEHLERENLRLRKSNDFLKLQCELSERNIGVINSRCR